MGCHVLLQGIFPAQGSNPCLLHRQAVSLPRSHQGSPMQRYTSTKYYKLSTDNSSWRVLSSSTRCSSSQFFTEVQRMSMEPQCKPCNQSPLTVRPHCCSVRSNFPNSQTRSEMYSAERSWRLSKMHVVITFWDHTTPVWCSSQPAGPSGLSILRAHNPCRILDGWSNNGPQSSHNSAFLRGGPDGLCQQSSVRLIEHRGNLEIPF